MSQTAHEHDGAAAQHPPHLQHHFDTPAQQFESAVLGMWLFLATEILLFGGMFCAYAVYRANHPEIFRYAHKFLSVPLGAFNTVVLLCSSFTMAAAVWAAQRNRRRLLVGLLAATIGCGGVFLSVKYVEYKHKWEEGLGWGKYYQPQHAVHAGDERAAGPAASAPAGVLTSAPAPAAATAGDVSPAWVFEPADTGPRGLLLPEHRPQELVTQPAVRNVQTFFAIYFGMTGLHGLHVIAGLCAIGWVLVRSAQGCFSAEYFTPVPMVGLYWHVVDLIWIYLFPLLYLIH